MDFIPTKSSALRSNAYQNHETVVYEAHKSKAKSKQQKDVKQSEALIPKSMDMKRARHEILKFGLSGFEPDKKEEAKIQLAIKLGAKPPKNKYKNYKLLLLEKQNAKQVQKEKLEYQQLGKNSLGVSTSKGKSYDRKRRKEKAGILDVYGKATLKARTESKKVK